MKNIIDLVRVLAAFVGLGIVWFIGPMTGALMTLVAFVVLDYLTGVIGAIAQKKLNSEIGFKGIAKKILIFIIVGIANLLDLHVFGTEALKAATIFFYLANEGISILENAGKLGVPLPKKLKEILEQMGKEDV